MMKEVDPILSLSDLKDGRDVFLKAILEVPTIKMFGTIFEILVERKWNDYSVEHKNLYKNVFGRICTELRSNKEFEQIQLVNQMKEVLGDQSSILFEAMKDYYDIFHGHGFKDVRQVQNVISRFSALYVAKSKETYKSKEMSFYFDSIKDYFRLKVDHPLVQKKVILPGKKSKFECLYRSGDEGVLEFLSKLMKQYGKIDSCVFWDLIDGFILNHHSSLEQIIEPPKHYYAFERYQKAQKLVSRLNHGYILYDGPEVQCYRDIIQYDSLLGQYCYTGTQFEEDVVQYQGLKQVFRDLKRDILFFVKTISVDERIDDSLLFDDFPFTDEYFVFDLEKSCEKFSVSDFIPFFHYFVSGTEWMLWYFLLLPAERDILIRYMSQYELFSGMNFSDLFELMMVPSVSQKSVAILGSDLVLRLCRSMEYTNKKSSEIVSLATELMVEMSNRNCSTVPYVSGETLYYRYSMYDFNDETVFLSGIDTDSCFKVGGFDHDFMSYCCIDKNGFVLKFTDRSDRFVGKASGFRNGNCVFINQFKTVYDDLGSGYFGEYEKDLIEVFKMACEDIISSSDSIDFVFVTKSYVLSGCPSNVSFEVTEKIGDKPMDHESEDWSNFVKRCPGLMECYGYFTTDYGSYDLICMASSRDCFGASDICFFDADAIYKRVRNSVVMVDFVDDEVVQKINRILGIHAYLNETDFKSFEVPIGASVMMGDHWFIVYQEEILCSCVLEFDEDAKVEFSMAMERIMGGPKLFQKSRF